MIYVKKVKVLFEIDVFSFIIIIRKYSKKEEEKKDYEKEQYYQPL
jgi:hypothetical protein